MRIGTIYSASDKSLFDALSQKKVTNSDLRELFLSRGILVSKDSSRKVLAEHFSRLFHDYHDYQLLAKLFGETAQRDKLSGLRISTEVTLESIQNAAFELKSKLEEAGATVKISTARGTRLDIEIKYVKVQFNRSEFRQICHRTAMISFHREDDGFMVHFPHSDEAQDWIDEIARLVKNDSSDSLEFREISLPSSMEPGRKTSFFTLLIRNVPDLPLRDVTDVFVTKASSEPVGDDDDNVGNPEIRIDRASFRGKGVLESEELRLLEKKGFYVSRIVWTATAKLEFSDVYEFEAQFADANACRDFTYLPRGIYKRTESGELKKGRIAFSREDERRYGRFIEAAARTALSELQGGAS